MEKEKSYQERMNKTTDYKFDAIKEYLKNGIKILDYGSGYNQEFIKKINLRFLPIKKTHIYHPLFLPLVEPHLSNTLS